MKNDIVWSDVGSGFGEPGGTPLQRIPGSTPPGISPLFPPLKTDNNSGTKLRKFHTNTGAHNPERSTAINSCNGVFTSEFIFG